MAGAKTLAFKNGVVKIPWGISFAGALTILGKEVKVKALIGTNPQHPQFKVRASMDKLAIPDEANPIIRISDALDSNGHATVGDPRFIMDFGYWTKNPLDVRALLQVDGAFDIPALGTSGQAHVSINGAGVMLAASAELFFGAVDAAIYLGWTWDFANANFQAAIGEKLLTNYQQAPHVKGPAKLFNGAMTLCGTTTNMRPDPKTPLTASITAEQDIKADGCFVGLGLEACGRLSTNVARLDFAGTLRVFGESLADATLSWGWEPQENLSTDPDYNQVLVEIDQANKTKYEEKHTAEQRLHALEQEEKDAAECERSTVGFSACIVPPPRITSAIVVTSGGYPHEIGWSLTCGGVTITGGAPYNATHGMPPGDCTLEMHDSYGDGWNGAEWSGWEHTASLDTVCEYEDDGWHGWQCLSGNVTFTIPVSEGPSEDQESREIQLAKRDIEDIKARYNDTMTVLAAVRSSYERGQFRIKGSVKLSLLGDMVQIGQALQPGDNVYRVTDDPASFDMNITFPHLTRSELTPPHGDPRHVKTRFPHGLRLQAGAAVAIPSLRVKGEASVLVDNGSGSIKASLSLFNGIIATSQTLLEWGSCPTYEVRQEKAECALQSDYLGEYASAELCSLKAREEGCRTFMFSWTAKYWGCRCCSEPDPPTEHSDWTLYNVLPTDSRTFHLPKPNFFSVTVRGSETDNVTSMFGGMVKLCGWRGKGLGCDAGAPPAQGFIQSSSSCAHSTRWTPLNFGLNALLEINIIGLKADAALDIVSNDDGFHASGSAKMLCDDEDANCVVQGNMSFTASQSRMDMEIHADANVDVSRITKLLLDKISAEVVTAMKADSKRSTMKLKE